MNDDAPRNPPRRPARADEADTRLDPHATAPDCGVSRRQLWSWVDRSAPELEHHLADCPRCRELAAQIREGIARAAEHGGPEAPTPDAAPPLALPESIGGYRVIREISRGGMGVVYLAERKDDRFTRRVALKLLKRGMDTEDVLRRFRLERQVLGGLSHPNIAGLFDAGEAPDGRPYFLMEYVDGLDIASYCDRNHLRIEERLDLFAKVCAGVHYAHQNLVVHRDLKPANILVTGDGQPKLLDFGIAKLLNPDVVTALGAPTAADTRVMTPEYASPEQVRGEPISTASDIYSLGVLLYELLSGHPPYRLPSRTRAVIEQVVCGLEPERPSTAVGRTEEIDARETPTGDTTITPDQVARNREIRPERLRRRLAGDLDNIVLKAMHKAPQRRYRSAEQLAADIDRHLRGLPVLARPDTVTYRVGKFVRRNRVGVAAATAITLLLVGGITSTSWGLNLVAIERDRVEHLSDSGREVAKALIGPFNDAIQELDGSLPARRLLVTTALEYLENVSRDVGDDAELKAELADAYDRVGDIRGGTRNPSLGDIAGAVECYDKAIELRRELAAQRPGDEAIQRSLASSYENLADHLRIQGRSKEALHMSRQQLALAETLYAADPRDDERARYLAVALQNVGRALILTGDGRAGLELYERSRILREELAARHPEDPRTRRELSVFYLRLGDRYSAVGEYEEALRWHERAIAIRTELAALDPESSRARRDLAVARFFAGEACLDLGRPADGLEHLSSFHDVAVQRAADNPGSARAQRDLAQALLGLGRAYAMRGETGDAVDAYRSCLAVISPLARSEPDQAEYAALLVECLERTGEMHATSGSRADAIHEGREAVRVAASFAGRDGADVRRRADHARVLSKLGVWLAADGRAAEARGCLTEALATYESLHAAEPELATLREGLAGTLLALAPLSDADTAAEHLQRARRTVQDARWPAAEALRGRIDDELARCAPSTLGSAP